MSSYSQDSYSNFIMAIKSPSTKDQYVIRLKRFFRFLRLQPPIEKQCSSFMQVNNHSTQIISYIQSLRQRVDNKELVWATLRNHIKPIKLFCEMNDIDIPWSKLVRGLPSGRRYSHDRAPTIEEIRKIVEYPDRRIKAIVYAMTSGGIRVGAWDYLKWGHIMPIERDGAVVAAKVRVYFGEEDEYFTFITPEAYKALADWMEFRKKAGEHVTKDSWLMRNLWDCRGATTGRGKVNEPSKLEVQGLRALVLNAIRYQGVRTEKGKRRYEFKALHGFRKYFKTHAEQTMRPINVEMLMGHSTGISDSYYRPPEKDLLEDYLKAVPLLTINDTVPASTVKEQSNQIQILKEQMNKMQKDMQDIKEFELRRLKDPDYIRNKMRQETFDEMKRTGKDLITVLGEKLHIDFLVTPKMEESIKKLPLTMREVVVEKLIASVKDKGYEETHPFIKKIRGLLVDVDVHNIDVITEEDIMCYNLLKTRFDLESLVPTGRLWK